MKNLLVWQKLTLLGAVLLVPLVVALNEFALAFEPFAAVLEAVAFEAFAAPFDALAAAFLPFAAPFEAIALVCQRDRGNHRHHQDCEEFGHTDRTRHPSLRCGACFWVARPSGIALQFRRARPPGSHRTSLPFPNQAFLRG